VVEDVGMRVGRTVGFALERLAEHRLLVVVLEVDRLA
jgi:hypothetical protein